jgi:hypothetical protein
MNNDPLSVMPQNQPQMPQAEPSLAGGPPQQGMEGSAPGDPNAGGITEKEQMAQMISQVPIEQLIQMVKGSSPEQLAQQITQAALQSGIGQEEATAYSITLMKVIYEKIQDETGQAITEITGQVAPEPSLAGPQPPAGPQMGGQMPSQGMPQPGMMGGQ